MAEAPVLTLDLAVRQGRFALNLKWSGALGLLGLFGPSGSGKTTVLEVIAGLRAPAYGRVALGSHVLVDTSAHTWVRPRAPRRRLCPAGRGAVSAHDSPPERDVWGRPRGVDAA